MFSLSHDGGVGATFGSRLILLSSETEITVEAPGYYPHRQTISGADGSSLLIELKPLPGSVVISVDAQVSVNIALDGVPQTTGNLLEVELDQGAYQLELSGKGVASAEHLIEIEGLGKTQEFSFVLEATVAYLSVAVVPADADVKLGEQTLELNGGRIEIPTGEHTLQLSKDGYATSVRNFLATSNQNVDLGVIKLQANPIVLELSSSPAGAAVSVGGSYMGLTNLVLNLPANVSSVVTLVKPTYSAQSITIPALAGQRIQRHVELGRESVEVMISSNVNANVHIDGTPSGFTPQTIQVNHGARVTISKEGYVQKSTTIESAKGAKQDIYLELLTHEEDKLSKIPVTKRLLKDIVLQRIDPSEFTMRPTVSTWGDTTEQLSESTQRVKISRRFYISRHEITERDFKQFKQSSTSNSRKPQVEVSWREAVQFCNWLSQREKLDTVYEVQLGGIVVAADSSKSGFRLPTEAEWFYVTATSANTRHANEPFLWGGTEDIPRGIGNLAGRESQRTQPTILEQYVDATVGIAEIGSLPPNRFQLYDLIGNAREWLHDRYDTWPSSPTLVDYSGPSSGGDRVVRGGSFQTGSVDKLRTHAREFGARGEPDIGFRVARTIN